MTDIEPEDNIPLAQLRSTNYMKNVVVVQGSCPPSLNSVAAMIGDTKAQETVNKLKESIENLRKAGQFVLVTPQGEMFVGTDRDVMRVLMSKVSIADTLKHGLKL